MKTYHKINSLWKRDRNNPKIVLFDEVCTDEFRALYNCPWNCYEKVDGTNIRIIVKDGKPEFRGKTDRAQIPGPLVAALVEQFPDEKFKDFADMCVYGEGYGPKINGGGKYRDTPGFVGFDVKVGDVWLDKTNVRNILDKLDAKMVPYLGEMTVPQAVDLVKSGLTSKWGDFEAEGLVATPVGDFLDRQGRRIITKIKASHFNAR